MHRERGFSLVEVIVAGAIMLLILTTIVLIGRQFLFGLLWSGETFAGVHEAALIEGQVRRDLSRAAVADGRLAVTIGAGTLSIALPAGARPARIDYRLDETAHALVRTEEGGDRITALPLGAGLVRSFAVRPRWIVRRGGALAVAEALAPDDRVERAGLLVQVVVKGQAVAGNPDAAQGLTLATHVFPHFANLALASTWRPVGGAR